MLRVEVRVMAVSIEGSSGSADFDLCFGASDVRLVGFADLAALVGFFGLAIRASLANFFVARISFNFFLKSTTCRPLVLACIDKRIVGFDQKVYDPVLPSRAPMSCNNAPTQFTAYEPTGRRIFAGDAAQVIRTPTPVGFNLDEELLSQDQFRHGEFRVGLIWVYSHLLSFLLGINHA
jgi:uncharacterized membrane protein